MSLWIVCAAVPHKTLVTTPWSQLNVECSGRRGRVNLINPSEFVKFVDGANEPHWDSSFGEFFNDNDFVGDRADEGGRGHFDFSVLFGIHDGLTNLHVLEEGLEFKIVPLGLNEREKDIGPWGLSRLQAANPYLQLNNMAVKSFRSSCRFEIGSLGHKVAIPFGEQYGWFADPRYELFVHIAKMGGAVSPEMILRRRVQEHDILSAKS